MARIQVSDQFGSGRLVTQARPVAQSGPVGDNGAWKGLAEAFAAGDLLLENNRQLKAQEDTERATKFANSVTVEELGKRVSSGEMLASESPVFAATVQHIFGANSQAALERDVLGKVTTGELKFNSPQEIDQYLTENRNTTLAGHSKYAVAGFDKGYSQLKEKLMDAVAKTNNAEAVTQAIDVATDRLGNKLIEVADGDPTASAQALLGEYQLLRKTAVLPAGATKDVLLDVVTRASASGKVGLVDSLLKSELEGIGTVQSFLGSTKAETLRAQAGAKFDQVERQRVDDESLPWMQAADRGELKVDKLMEWAQSPQNRKFTSSAFINSLENRNAAALHRMETELTKARMQAAVDASEAEARKRVEDAAMRGRLWEIQGTNVPKVLTTSGTTKDYAWKDNAAQIIKERTASLPFDKQVAVWSQNGLENPDWKAQVAAGMANLDTIRVDSKGKPVGSLNDAGKQAIDLFKNLNTVSPTYAREMVGEGAYKRFSDIAFLTHLGRTPDNAAAIAYSANSGDIQNQDIEKLVSKVRSGVDDLTARPWYKVGWVQSLMGDNTEANTAQLTGHLRKYAELLVKSGEVTNAEEAVSKAAEYLKSPAVSTKINGTLYLRSELPTPPNGTQEEWMEKFLDKVPKAAARELKYDPSDVRLEYLPSLRAYQAMVGGRPLEKDGMVSPVYTKEDIQRWFAEEQEREVAASLAKVKGRTAKASGPFPAFGPAQQRFDSGGREIRLPPPSKKP